MIKAYAALKEKSDLISFDYDPGRLHSDDIEIDILYCGICHSDLSVIDNAWGFSQYPLVPGHEIIGTVSEIGKNVQGFVKGDHVGIGWHSGYCNHCDRCDVGDHNLCKEAQATIIGHYGGFANKVRAQAKSVIHLPKGIDLQSAGPFLCGGITVFNPLVQFNIQPTSKAAVIGIGGLGHLALQFLNAWGCEVTAFTSSDYKRKEALKMGAHHTLNSKDPKEIQSAEESFDLIISTVNVKLDWNLYASTLAPKGRLHFVGATLDPLDISVMSLLPKQATISASPVGSPAVIRKMLDFACLHHIQPKVEVFPLSQVNTALQKLRAGEANYRIVLQNDIM